MGFAYGTLINTPDGSKEIEEFHKGDYIIKWYDNVSSIAWVDISTGSGIATHSLMVYLEFDGGELIVNSDQPFIMADKTIVKAKDLHPVQHQLINAGGEAVGIRKMNMGQYRGGIHTVVTNAPIGLIGHFIVANGIVCGDYAVEVGRV